MMIAYLILAHANFSVCQELIDELLSDERSVVYLHIDAKAKQYDALNGNIHFVRRVKVHWGGESMVEATLNLLEESLRGQYDRYVLLSGDSFPINDMAKTNDILMQQPLNEFLSYYENNLGSRGYDRAFCYWLFNEHSSKVCWLINRYLVKLQKQFKYKRKFPRELSEFRIGSQWWGLTYESAQKVYDICSHKKVRKFLRHTRIPDEFFVQSTLGSVNSKDNLMFYEFDFLAKGTYNGVSRLSTKDIPRCIESGKLFCRKVNCEFIKELRLKR